MAEANSYATFASANYPAEGNVLNTAPTYGDAINVLDGTYDPGAGGVVPDEDDVRSGVAVGATTGNLRVPVVADVRLGTVYDSTDVAKAQTGTLDLPGVADVRSGVQFDNLTKTGLVQVPRVGRVITGVAVDQTVGTFDYPQESQVAQGVTYGEDGTEFTGTLDPGAGGVIPDPSDVRLDVPVGASVGNVIIPVASDVRLNVAYDSMGSVLGTYDCGGTGDPSDVGWVG